eukprot:44728-Hanusia_phi.AAC.1
MVEEDGREIFDLALREPVKALDLSYNLLGTPSSRPVALLRESAGGSEIEDLGGYARPRQL